MSSDQLNMTDLERDMAKFDWFYEYTEDHSIFVVGAHKEIEIVRRLQKIDTIEAAALIKRYVPQELQLLIWVRVKRVQFE